MLKQGILHPQLARILAEIRHMDMLVIGDAGLPIPKGVERVDLGWKEGSPGYLEVLDEILKAIKVEKAIFAKEALSVSPEFHQQALASLEEKAGLKGEQVVDYIDHVDLKKLSGQAKAIVLTGEFTPYTNVILVAGCVY